MRKGISFTLTIIVAAVLLLTAALTLITVFGSQITSFVGVGESTVSSAQKEARCSQVARRIQTNICDVDSSASASGSKNTFSTNGRDIDATVTIDGEPVNCVGEGYMRGSCPVIGENSGSSDN